MHVSDQRIEANRRNAAKSTGPTSSEGKDHSRRNALKHGFRSLTLSVEDPALVRERAIGVHEMLKPQNAMQAWFCAVVAILTIRLDRLRDLEKQIRNGSCWRALSFWEDDQRDQARRTGGRLARNPVRVVTELRRSAQGCEWLIERWAMLASVADRAPWTDEQRTLAHDLLGTPPEVREDAPGYTVDADGRLIDAGEYEASFARAQIAELEIHRDRVAEADEIARHLAIADLDDFNNRGLHRIHRYERSLERQLDRAFQRAQFESPHAAAKAPLPTELPTTYQAEPPLIEPNEPIVIPPIPNEAILIAPAATIEPITAPTEPIIIKPIPNEPIPTSPNQPNEAIMARFPHAPEGLSRLHPELAALLEEGLPDPRTLDPAWCRDYLAATIGSDESGRLDMPRERQSARPNHHRTRRST